MRLNCVSRPLTPRSAVLILIAHNAGALSLREPALRNNGFMRPLVVHCSHISALNTLNPTDVGMTALLLR